MFVEFQYCSDLLLDNKKPEELENFFGFISVNSFNLILSGNIVKDIKSNVLQHFLEFCLRNFRTVMYVLGDEEYSLYPKDETEDYINSLIILLNIKFKISRIYNLTNKYITIGKFIFYGLYFPKVYSIRKSLINLIFSSKYQEEYTDSKIIVKEQLNKLLDFIDKNEKYNYILISNRFPSENAITFDMIKKYEKIIDMWILTQSTYPNPYVLTSNNSYSSYSYSVENSTLINNFGN